MRIVTRYQSDDGSEWKTEVEARRRDLLCAECMTAQTLLRDPPGSRGGYVQQLRESVRAYKAALIDIARRHGVYGLDKVTDPDQVHNQGMVGRFIEDSGLTPLSRAWYRVMCVDAEGREWEQPYYAMNPGTGPDVAL